MPATYSLAILLAFSVQQRNPAMQPVKDDPSLPRVGFVGMVRRQRAVSSSSVLCFDG